MKHTPGPWIATQLSQSTLIESHDGNPVVYVPFGNAKKSDLALMAAAPELLAALRAMLHRFGDAADKPTPAELLAKAAITKATGAEHEAA